MSDIGIISRDWYEGALQNGTHEEIESWFSEMQNADCEIDKELTVWVYRTSGEYTGGLWLDQDLIDDICRRIDAQ
jgi:type IV secretory pathway ATPase VirB11/archaellum biosynthesis ATPase